MSELFTEYTNFLNANPEYLDEIVSLAIEGKRSLCVDWNSLYGFSSEIAASLLEDPISHIKAFNEAFYNRYRLHATEQVTEGDLHVRIMNHPHPLTHREVGSEQVSKFISFSGITLSTSQVLPFIVTATYVCEDCGEITISIQERQFLRKPRECGGCNKKILQLDPSKSHYIDIQYLGVQEMPEDLPPGQIPVSILVELRDDICGSVVPGDRVTINGILKARQKQPTARILESYVEANYVETIGRGLEALRILPEDEAEILDLAKDPWVHRRVTQSIASTIYGMDYCKEAVALQLFGGVTKNRDGIRLRGDINVLLAGDPGTGKSQILMYASQASPRGLYTMGRGSTAAGLTAAVVKNQHGFSLEAGAMVLADKGLCCIDELEKMRDEDRGAIHPAMEQQVVSIAKGGIIATLNARCAVLAAANPTLGRYNPYQTIAQNISNLPVTLLSRFDLIFMIRDLPEEEKDSRVSSHVLNLHRDSQSSTPIPIELLRKYISYSQKIEPHLTEEAANRLKDFYLKMRMASTEAGEASPLAITVRQLESLIRLSEARARMHLREEINVTDAEAAISLTQRSLEQVGIDVTTGQIDIDILYSGKPRSLQFQLQKVLTQISEIERITGIVKDEDLYEALVEDHGISRTESSRLIGILMRDGTIYSPRPGYYKRTQ